MSLIPVVLVIGGILALVLGGRRDGNADHSPPCSPRSNSAIRSSDGSPNSRTMTALRSSSRGPRSLSSALTQTEDTAIGASFSKIALAEVVHVKGRQSLLWASM
jgi:hypothetical protein